VEIEKQGVHQVSHGSFKMTVILAHVRQWLMIWKIFIRVIRLSTYELLVIKQY